MAARRHPSVPAEARPAAGRHLPRLPRDDRAHGKPIPSRGVARGKPHLPDDARIASRSAGSFQSMLSADDMRLIPPRALPGRSARAGRPSAQTAERRPSLPSAMAVSQASPSAGTGTFRPPSRIDAVVRDRRVPEIAGSLPRLVREDLHVLSAPRSPVGHIGVPLDARRARAPIVRLLRRPEGVADERSTSSRRPARRTGSACAPWGRRARITCSSSFDGSLAVVVDRGAARP
jgi:hypothetical protein